MLDMQALYIDNGTIQLQTCPRPICVAKHSLVCVEMAGICSTDLQLIAGYKNFSGIPGHEFVGYVVESADTKILGHRVVASINISCGKCDACQKNITSHCYKRKVIGILNHPGAHAEYLVVPNENLYSVPDTIPNEQAVFAEPLAAALQILQQVHISPQHKVAVIGDGKLGLLVAQVLALTGCQLHIIGRHPEKMSLLPASVISHTSDPQKPLPKNWVDIAIECTGNPQGFQTAKDIVKPRGTIVLKSTFAGELQIALSDLVVNEVQVVGSRCGDIAAALRLLQQQKIDVKSLISDIFPLSEGVEAYSKAKQKGVLKVLLQREKL